MTSPHLKRALALHRAGSLPQAAALYRRVLTADPDNADALHFLGLIAHQSGRHDDAIGLIQQAIAKRANPAYWYNLAHVFFALIDAARAEDALRQTIALAPRHAEALFHLGKLRAQSEDFIGAIDCYRRAIEAKPDLTDAYVNLGLLLNRTGDAAGAIRELDAALRLRPDDAEIHNNIGMVRGAIAPTEAIDDFRRALALKPENIEATTNLAKLLASSSRHADAVEILQRIVNHPRDDCEIHVMLATSFAELNRFDDAVRQLERAAAAAPQSLRPLVSLGSLYLRFGRFDDAYRCHLKIREMDPDNCDALVGILRHLKSDISESDAEQVTRLAEDASRPISERRRLHFALAAWKEAGGDYDAAFLHMDQGNRLRRMELEAESGPYDPAKQVARVDRLIKTFNEDYFRRVAGFGSESELPVFVVGMPRSGTTLCEQILASHSKVFGADELPDIGQIERELIQRYGSRGDRHDSGFAAHLTLGVVRSIAERQLVRLQSLAPRAIRIVDKMPMNFYRLSLIATLFPKARIIHCSRDPMDMALSCFSKDYANPPIWATDLRNIVHMHRQHGRLLEHWRRVLPIDILELRYEDVIYDIDTSARALTRHCGIEWEGACLEFYRTDRQVKTASFEQVRRPIYDTSIGRWRRFERYVAPLREALNES